MLGGPCADPSYVPPTLLLGRVPTLLQLVQDLTSRIATVREDLEGHLANSVLDLQALQGMQFEQLSRLRILSRFTARLDSLIKAEVVHPFAFYLELKELFAELVSLYPHKKDFPVLDYDHDDCFPCFQLLASKIRTYLHGIIKPDFRKIEFVQNVGMFTADLEPAFFEDATGFFLGIDTKIDPVSLSQMVLDTDQFKLMPTSFGIRAIRGVKLAEERFPPPELPNKTGRYFYRLNTDQSKRIWEQFVQEPSATIHFNGEKQDEFCFTLFATVPNPI